MIEIQRIDILRDNISTLRDTSHDNDNDEYMTESLLPVVNFDAVSKTYIEGLKTSYFASSNDALIDTKNGKLVFVEFKNGSLDKYKIRRKIYDSILLLCDILGCDISKTREIVDYILVYNGEKHPYVKEHNSYKIIENTVSQRANEKVTALKLEEFEGYCFNKVYTYNKEEFNVKFVCKQEQVV